MRTDGLFARDDAAFDAWHLPLKRRRSRFQQGRCRTHRAIGGPELHSSSLRKPRCRLFADLLELTLQLVDEVDERIAASAERRPTGLHVLRPWMMKRPGPWPATLSRMPANPDGYVYAYEKIHEARSALMAPHGRGGEDGAFVAAFARIDLLRPENVADLPEPAREYWAEIMRIIDRTDLTDPENVGLSAVRVSQMDFEQRADFSRYVDELASWLSHYRDTDAG
jgi:hypothetical protein